MGEFGWPPGARVCLADAEGRLPVNGVGQFMLVSAAAIFNEYVSCGRIAGRALPLTELPSLTDDHVIRQRAKDPTVDQLIELIGDLPSQTRRVFTLHRVYGYSQETIAQRLHISPEAVQGHLIRAGQYIFGVLYKGGAASDASPAAAMDGVPLAQNSRQTRSWIIAPPHGVGRMWIAWGVEVILRGHCRASADRNSFESSTRN